MRIISKSVCELCNDSDVNVVELPYTEDENQDSLWVCEQCLKKAQALFDKYRRTYT